MDTDLLIIGAGAAGLGAARRARARGLRIQLLEARRRIGGRAWTDSRRFGVPVDHGCHWLHAADINPLRALADRWSMGYRRSSRRNLMLFRQGVRQPDTELAAFQAYCQRCWDSAEAAGRRGEDRPLAEMVERTSQWYPLFASWCAALNGFGPERVSTLDWFRYCDTGNDWPVRAGYGTLVARLGRGLDIHCATPVRELRWSGPGIEAVTPRGTLRARAALVTVSTAVLAGGAVRFRPALPVWKQSAIEAVPLGHANKVMLGLGQPLVDVAAHSFARFDTGRRETLGWQLQPFGYSLAIGYAAGTFARELEQAGRPAMIDFALEQFKAMFGNTAVRTVRVKDASGWSGDPWIGGAYSLARPGQAEQRGRLAQPLARRLYFAGEAVSASAFGTAHGAYQSGCDAVDLVRRQLSP